MEDGGWNINGLTGQMNYTYSFKEYPFTGKKKLWCTDDCGGEFWLNENMMLLDPKFWQALGNSEGWKSTGLVRSCLCIPSHSHEIEHWEFEMHNFIDWVIDGKSYDEFFNKILK